MENVMDVNSYGNHEIKVVDRNIINLTGINKITIFDYQEFLMESSMGIILLKGEGLEIVKLDILYGTVTLYSKVLILKVGL